MENVKRMKTIAEACFPKKGVLSNSLVHNLQLILGGSIFISLTAQLAFYLPFSPVPITMQTFGVLLIGLTYGSKRGALTLIVYLIEGGIGLPVFANGGCGIAYLFGPTGGYLVGFVVATFAVGYLAEKGWDRKILSTFTSMLIGTIILFSFGLLWLNKFVGTEKLFVAGLLPFIPGEILKSILVAFSLPTAWKVINKKNNTQ